METTTIPLGLCQCGCGEPTGIAPSSDANRGWIAGQPVRYRRGHDKRQWNKLALPNPSGLCLCGCGETTPLAMQNSVRRGLIQGQHVRFIPYHQGYMRRGEVRASRRPWTERFPRFVTPGDYCWEWNGKIAQNGYGVLTLDTTGKTVYAHRAAWAFASGEWPVEDADQHVLHTCDNRRCVRYDDVGIYVVRGRELPRRGHLFLGTDADNCHDMWDKGRASPPPIGRRGSRRQEH